MIDLPRTRVEWSPTTGMRDTPVWVDITARLLAEPNIERGKSSPETYEHDAGTVIFRFRNSDGHLTPENSGSQWYPNVTTDKRIRVVREYQGVDHVRFVGFIDEFTPTWEFEVGEVLIKATDWFKELARRDLPRSVWDLELARIGPVHWWPLGESENPLTDPIGGLRAEMYEIEFGDAETRNFHTNPSDSIVAHHDDRSQEFFWEADRLTETYGVDKIDLVPPYAIGVVFKVRPSGVFSINRKFFYARAPGGFAVSIGYIDSDTLPNIFTAQLPGFADSGTVEVNDNQPHFAVAAVDGTGAQTVWVDGVDVTDSSGAFLASVVDGDYWIGTDENAPLNPFNPVNPLGLVDELFILDFVPTQAQVDILTVAFRDAWASDMSGERLNRILDWMLIPAGDRDIDAGSSILGGSPLGTKALAYAQLVEKTELGRFFVTAAGKIRFHERARALRETEPLAYFECVVASDYFDIKPQFSDRDIVNLAEVSRYGGNVYRVEDADSIEVHGEYPASGHTELLLNNDEAVLGHGQYLVVDTTEPHHRVRELVLRPGSRADVWIQVLTLEVGDRISVTWKPPGMEPVTHDVLIESWNEEGAELIQDLTVVLGLSPAPPTDYLIYDSLTQGNYDENRYGP